MPVKSAVVYTVLRLLVFLVPFGIMMMFPILRDMYWLAALFAALIGISLSMLFLRRPLDDVAESLAQRRARRQTTHKLTARERDAEIEDGANESFQPRPRASDGH
jgi:ABC-type siderophore export system fused ATPase/permease subunit